MGNTATNAAENNFTDFTIEGERNDRRETWKGWTKKEW